MSRRSSLRRVLAVLVVAMLFFAACSSDDDDDAGGTGDTPSDTSSGSPSDPTAVVSVGSDLQQSTGAIPLNPLLNQAGGTPQDPLYYLIYGRLMRPLLDGTIEPDLAESVDLVDDSTIQINLREGLTFSDGTPFDADAVAAYYETVLDNEDTEILPGVTLVNSYQEPFFDLQSATVEDPTTVVLSIADGAAAGWYDLHISGWTASIVKVPVVDDTKPIGAGPFSVVEFLPGQSATLTKNDSYWRADEVRFGGVNVETIAFSQPASGLAGVQGGQLDWVFTDPTQIGAVSGEVEVLAQPSPNKAVWLHWCKSGGPLEDPRVRVAINKAFDRDAINDAVYSGTASPSVQLWPNDHRLANPDLNETLAYDPEGARQLLEEAGYGDGLALDMYPIQVFGLPDVAEIVQQQLADVGITVTIVPTSDYVNQYLQSPSPDAMGMYPANAAGTAKLNAFTGTGLGNVCEYEDPELTAIINELNTVSESSDEAEELWHEAADIIVPEALSGFIMFRSDLVLYNTDRIGDPQPLGGGGDFKLPDPFVTFVKSGS